MLTISSCVLGELNCQAVGTAKSQQSPDLLVVLCHGYGAPANDLVPLSQELLEITPGLADRTLFLFPAAPLSLDELGLYGGRAWWHLDLERFMSVTSFEQLRERCQEVTPEIEVVRGLLNGMLNEARDVWQIPMSRIVLGGFSQGAILSTSCALQGEEQPAALCILSGMLVNEPVWKERAQHHAGLRVLQSHGRQDPLLPIQAARWLRQLLEDAGAQVDFVEFPGGHGIPAEALQHMASLLTSLLP